MPDLIRCRHCKGTGKHAITGVYAGTLAFLREQQGELTGADLARLVGCKPTAANNRLAALERLGLATSRWYGRKRLYKAKGS